MPKKKKEKKKKSYLFISTVFVIVSSCVFLALNSSSKTLSFDDIFASKRKASKKQAAIPQQLRFITPFTEQKKQKSSFVFK